MPVKRLYADEAAATAVEPAALKAMQPYFTSRFGNPASLHAEGRSARAAVDAARLAVAKFLEAQPDEITFTGSATEANNLALFGSVDAQTDRRHVIISNIEHPSVAEVAAELERRGMTVEILPVGSDGRLDPALLRRALRNDTGLVSVHFANNEIGTIQPIRELARLCQQRGVLFHTDACQAAAWLPLRVPALHADLLTVSAAKLRGPKGIAALYHRRGLRLKPVIFGGGQEQGLRSGTENVPAIVGFGVAVHKTQARLQNADRVRTMRDMLIDRLRAIPGVRLNGHRTERLPNNVNISIDGVEGETLVLGLDALGVACSSGSACSAINRTGSPVLEAIGAVEGGNVRFSLSWETTRRDVERIARAVQTVLARQRPLAGVWERAVATARKKYA